MKKFIFVVFMIGCFFSFSFGVRAESFVEGKFISGEYINKEIAGKTYYMTMQYIKDSQGNIVYCLEPFVTFENGKIYTEYTGDLSSYSQLSNEKKRKISLLIYYGYGYGDRTSSKWYVITQYLLWKEVSPKANIYFTETLNGKKVIKYEEEMKQILNDVALHDAKPSFVKDYSVAYQEDLVIPGIDENYEILSDYTYTLQNGLHINDVMEDGVIHLKKISNYYQNKVTIYDSGDSQDLIRPGNVENISYLIHVHVLKGDITLDIRDDHSVYSVESSLKDTCYEIRNGEKIVDKVCTGDEPLLYKTNDLPYGVYEIYQVSHGIGYKEDVSIYRVQIDEQEVHPSVLLNNQLIKNTLTLIKYACRNQICAYEEGAMFQVQDKNGNVVSSLSTDSTGQASVTLGYGSYDVSQLLGLEDYTFSLPFRFKIVDEETEHQKKLFNYYIEDEEEPSTEVEEVTPPDTKVDVSFLDVLFELLQAIFVLFSIC